MCGSLHKNDTYECCGGVSTAQTINTCNNEKCAGSVQHVDVCKKPLLECPKTCAIIRTVDAFMPPSEYSLAIDEHVPRPEY
ncbi:hypothetical protein D9619_003858 [Psilocybe cf. subviscida]|uniref:Uncharacterized protein n=1 Tax=Psilocybe cf. subviscida TaxID=2480587 RepID=A0A8H5AWP7_9AGAR|nr:hypothetical protein D9619_003858 [Psilocybe cf. subviscida]